MEVDLGAGPVAGQAAQVVVGSSVSLSDGSGLESSNVSWTRLFPNECNGGEEGAVTAGEAEASLFMLDSG